MIVSMPASASWGTPPPSIGSEVSSLDGSVSVQNQWWNTNLPREQWTEICPGYLVEQNDKNISIMSTRDEDYRLVDWDEARHFIETKRIDHFGRTPTELRRYHKFTHDLKERYGSVLYYMQHERLKWTTLQPSGATPFTNPADYKIIFNDWPYAMDPNIKHLVIWTKFVLEDDPRTEELTLKYHTLIEKFVVDTFCSSEVARAQGGQLKLENRRALARENVIWFKNWARLRSVPALEHFHVLVYKAPSDLLRDITQGDRPMSEKLDG